MFTFDHLAVACETLDAGCAAVEAALGAAPEGGGQHPHFGTHNRLLSLGGSEYLEVIAVNPAAPPPRWPRWFDLDRFSGTPRLTNWILRCPDLEAALDSLGPDAGSPVSLRRGEFRWQMAVPETGILPFDNLHPALIHWQSRHPAPLLPDCGLRLRELVVRHPRAGRIGELLDGLGDPRVRFETGPPALVARIDTPAGVRALT